MCRETLLQHPALGRASLTDSHMSYIYFTHICYMYAHMCYTYYFTSVLRLWLLVAQGPAISIKGSQQKYVCELLLSLIYVSIESNGLILNFLLDKHHHSYFDYSCHINCVNIIHICVYILYTCVYIIYKHICILYTHACVYI